jgi:hypothetical protein
MGRGQCSASARPACRSRSATADRRVHGSGLAVLVPVASDSRRSVGAVHAATRPARRLSRAAGTVRDLSCRHRARRTAVIDTQAATSLAARPVNSKNRVTILASAYPNRRSPQCRRARLTDDDQFNVGVLAVQIDCTCSVGRCVLRVGVWHSVLDCGASQGTCRHAGALRSVLPYVDRTPTDRA